MVCRSRPEQLASAMALVAKIAGVSSDEDKQISREAQIAKYIMLLYEDVFEEWSRRNADRLLEIARHACILAKLKRARPGTTTLDAFVDFRDSSARTWTSRMSNSLRSPNEEVLRFLKEAEHATRSAQSRLRLLHSQEYPTHRMLAGADSARRVRWRGRRSRDALVAVVRDGNYGCLFDGTSNISLTGKIAHFELGYIPESAKLLRAVAGFLNHQLHATAHHHDAAPLAEAERARRGRAVSRHSRW